MVGENVKNMRWGFKYTEDDNCYHVYLMNSRIILKYARFYEGNYQDCCLYAYKQNDVTFEELINYFLKHDFFTPMYYLFKTSAIDSCMALLAFPYFDELYQFVKDNYTIIDRIHLKMLKKIIFEGFASDIHHKFNVDLSSGSWHLDPSFSLFLNFYFEHQYYEKSKEIIALIDSRLKKHYLKKLK